MWRDLFSKPGLLLGLSFLLLAPVVADAQELHQDVQEVLTAEVLDVISNEEAPITGTDATKVVQTVRVQITEGERSGEVVTITSEVVELQPGDDILVTRFETINGEEEFTYNDFERRPILLLIALLFVALLLILSRWQGVRALISLAASIGAILFVLVPALLAGYNPALTTIGVAAVVLSLVLFGTHGVNPRTIIAFGGTFSAVAITGGLAYVSVEAMRLTGFGDDAAVYLNFATNGQLDLAGLLLGGIVIGILGVLDDVSITQASVVQELKSANPSFNAYELYSRAIKVGRDHIGSLVNTLALAYAGVALPLILLYASSSSDIWLALNNEVVAVELVRIMIGSIGLILAVPATTLVAAWYFQNRTVLPSEVHSHHHH